MECKEVIRELESLSNEKSIEGMARFGITPEKTFGVSMPNLRKMGKRIGTDHDLARELWEAGYRETRILASIIDDPDIVTRAQADEWVKDFDYWEICDQCCMNLFWRVPYADDLALEWSSREEEFTKRSGFVLMACLAWKDKKADNNRFVPFYPAMKRESGDDRKLVKKAISWALRSIGKKNRELNLVAVEVAEEIKEQDSKSARWIASDVLRELTSQKIQNRFK